MRLADDDVIVMIGSERFTLRPTLRAATRLERLLDGYEALCSRILAGNLGLITTIIAETNAQPITPAEIRNRCGNQPLSSYLPELIAAALSIVAKLAGHDGESSNAPPSDASTTSFRKFHLELFRIAAGNLGWPPDQAWNATPAEILEAYRGRNDLLRGIFGGEAPDDPSSGPDMNARLDRAGLESLRGRGRIAA